MNTSVVCLLELFAIVSTIQSTFGAYIEVPDDLLQDFEEPSVHSGARYRRQLSLQGAGSEKSGYVNLGGQRNLFDNGKTKLDGSFNAGTNWQRGAPTINTGTARLDGQRTLFNDGTTRLNANGFAQRDIGTGMRPHDSFGAGFDVSRTLTKGKAGSIEAFGGYQQQWNTPNRNNFNVGIRGTFG